MKIHTCPNRFRLSTLTPLLVLALAVPWVAAQDQSGEFSKGVIDIGIVAKDVGKSAKFYTEAIGLTEVKGFSVTGEMGKKIGLIDNQPADVRVFVPGSGEGSTRIKLMSFPQAPGKAADQASSTPPTDFDTSRSLWPAPTRPWND